MNICCTLFEMRKSNTIKIIQNKEILQSHIFKLCIITNIVKSTILQSKIKKHGISHRALLLRLGYSLGFGICLEPRIINSGSMHETPPWAVVIAHIFKCLSDQLPSAQGARPCLAQLLWLGSVCPSSILTSSPLDQHLLTDHFPSKQDITSATISSLFPLKHYSHCWVYSLVGWAWRSSWHRALIFKTGSLALVPPPQDMPPQCGFR